MSHAQSHNPSDTRTDTGINGDDQSAPALDELARRYLDLWQDQWTALAADPVMADMVARSFAMMGPAAAGFAGFANMLASADLFSAAQGMPAVNPFAQWGSAAHGSNQRDTSRQYPDPASGAATATAASEYRNNDMAELFNRISGMEQRLADLASSLAGSGDKPDAGSGKG